MIIFIIIIIPIAVFGCYHLINKNLKCICFNIQNLVLFSCVL